MERENYTETERSCRYSFVDVGRFGVRCKLAQLVLDRRNSLDNIRVAKCTLQKYITVVWYLAGAVYKLLVSHDTSVGNSRTLVKIRSSTSGDLTRNDIEVY